MGGSIPPLPTMRHVIHIDWPLNGASINRRYKFRHILADAYREFRDSLAVLTTGWETLKGEVYVHVDAGWPRVHRSGPAKGMALGDADSPLKCICDGLQAGGVFGNDAQIAGVTGTKRIALDTFILITQDIEEWLTSIWTARTTTSSMWKETPLSAKPSYERLASHTRSVTSSSTSGGRARSRGKRRSTTSSKRKTTSKTRSRPSAARKKPLRQKTRKK